MKMSEEMEKLRKGLDKRKIPWNDDSSIAPKEQIELMKSKGFTEEEADITMYRTHFNYKDHHYSVVFGYGSYGGINPIKSEVSDNKLELMIDKSTPVGWLTAKDVLDIIDKVAALCS